VSAPLSLTKYEAAGNDFLIIDERVSGAGDLDVAALCDRWTGVGADGLVRVGGDAWQGFTFRLTNADGTDAGISGNGMRCLAAFLLDDGAVEPGEPFVVGTPAGPRTVRVEPGEATVSMGTPNFTKAAIPMRGPAWETFQAQPFDIGGGITVTATALSMGNPHLVLFTDEDPGRYHLEHLGPALEHHEWFPERINVEIARIGADGIDVRVWERGVGETLACGTGACAVAVAAHERGLVPAAVKVRFRGGDLHVDRRTDGEVTVRGPVRHVFDATIDRSAVTS
jgi:diaminopimelate epimerase